MSFESLDFEQMREEMDYELNARYEYLREAYGPTSVDAHLHDLSEEEARDFMRVFLDETEVTCPSCGGEVILVFDNDGYHTWLHEMWRTCSCSGVILTFLVHGSDKPHELLIVEAPHAD